jgi:uncharacterized protein involved in exopolysaccharide biosynthesis
VTAAQAGEQAKADNARIFLAVILVVVGAGYWWYSQQKPKYGRK